MKVDILVKTVLKSLLSSCYDKQKCLKLRLKYQMKFIMVSKPQQELGDLLKDSLRISKR